MIRKNWNSLQRSCRLFLFSSLLLIGCRDGKSPKEISIIWKDGKAIGLSIPREFVRDIEEASIPSRIKIRLANHHEESGIAGNFNLNSDSIAFTPVIPLTRGLTYTVSIEGKRLATIPIPAGSNAPQVTAVYPNMDSVPENILKLYLSFSKPMVEGHSLEYISLRDEKGDSLPKIFLDLKPELWNEEGTMLTLWFDPGRIKRDLQPNKLLGPPLRRGRHYKLTVAQGWPDQEGRQLENNFSKDIIAIERDSTSPDPAKWNLAIPRPGTNEALKVDCGEPMDYVLLQNCIHLIDHSGKVLKGTLSVSTDQRSCLFVPVQAWISGEYTIQVEARLEDLAGNNLNRPFDRDLDVKTSKKAQEMYERKFIIAEKSLHASE